MLMAKCCKRKIIRKSADNAMANFFPIEELKNPLICVFDFSVDKGTTQRFAKQTSSRLLVGI